MTDDCIVMTPVSTIDTFTTVIEMARQRFADMMAMFGTFVVRQRNESPTLDNTGNITGFSSTFISISIMIFDRLNTNVLTQPGVNSGTETIGGKLNTARAYVDTGQDVVAGDFILINYDSGTGSYTEKYRVVEKEAHDIGSTTIFYTLYLDKEKI